MVKKVQSVLDVTIPYQIVFFICGIAPFYIATKQAPIRLIFTILQSIYKVFLIGATLIITYERSKLSSINSPFNKDYLSNSLDIMHFIMLVMIQCLMHVIVFLKYNDLKYIFLEITTIEENVLHVSSKIHKSRSRLTFKRRLFCISGLLMLTVLLSVVLNINACLSGLIPPLHWLIGSFSEIAIRCKSVEFCVMVQVLNELCSKGLTCINEFQRNLNCMTDRFFIDRILLQQKIVCIQNTQSKIWKTINEFNDYFSISILFHFLYNGLTITNLIYWMYMNFNEESYIYNLCRMLTLTFLMLDILMPCYLCDICIQRYQQIMRLLHDIKTTETDIPMKMCLREYLLQLTHQKLVFSCGGYFNVNLQCFGEIVLAITTYIVILIQFKLQAEKQ